MIFDNDGVLVDSEWLSVRLEAQVLSDLGWPLSEDEVIARFVGRTEAHMRSEVEAHLGHAIDWEVEFTTRYREVFERELLPVAGVVAAIDQLVTPFCVASSGTHERIRFTLGLTGLLDRFADRIFSAQDVAHGKPAPDLFLHAAAAMGVAPPGCVVVEDSAAGVAAARAAGMKVLAYAGGVTPAARLSDQGVTVFSDMAELPALLSV